jgi:hypothetical protein
VSQRRSRRAAWLLGGHAFLVGVSWFAVGLPLVLILGEHPAVEAALRSGAATTPLWILTGILAVAAVYAVPLLWPVHLAVGRYELGLVGRVARGDGHARRAAARVLNAQAVGYALIAVSLAAWWRGHPAFTVPLAVAALHVVLARQFR